jgi:lipopolysaccharide biosynthesis glycosyltransferase
MDRLQIPVLFCTDAIYFQHMGAAIASLLKTNSAHEFRILVVTQEKDPDGEEKLSGLVTKLGNASIIFKQFNLDSYRDEMPVDQYFTVAVYTRLFLTEFVDPSIKKILYLDGDLVVTTDIRELWETDLQGASLAAVPEPHAVPGDSETVSYPYFNSGVMLIDVERWRAANVLPKFLAFAKENAGHLPYHDQDVLNHTFAGKVRLLDYRWNFQSRWADFVAKKLNMSPEEFRRLRRSPAIVHFTSKYKPWFYKDEPHYKRLYYQALALTPWRDYSPPDRTGKSRVVKLLKLKRLKQKLTWHAPGMMRYLRRKLGI